MACNSKFKVLGFRVYWQLPAYALEVPCTGFHATWMPADHIQVDASVLMDLEIHRFSAS